MSKKPDDKSNAEPAPAHANETPVDDLDARLIAAYQAMPEDGEFAQWAEDAAKDLLDEESW